MTIRLVDGNGRTARLVMNALLMAHGYPAAIIRKRDRLAYIGALEKAQLGGSKDDYEGMIVQAVDRSLDIYLKALGGDSSMENLDRDDEALMKIGELAKKTKETVATIRYWTKECLLQVETTTDAGYQLYHPSMIKRCGKIQQLKAKRLTLAEIKVKLA